MIYGIGVDLVTVSRIARVHRRHKGRFAQRLLHPRERQEYSRARDPVEYLAKAFAAKEAFAKALGTGFRGLAHDEVGMVRGALGRPQLVFSTGLKRRLARLKIRGAQVSLSDEGDLVCAMVVLEK